jgi:hypothetical protein
LASESDWNCVIHYFLFFSLISIKKKGPSGKDRRPWDWSCWQKRVTMRRFSVYTPDRRPQPQPPPPPRHLTLPGAIQPDRISTPYLRVSIQLLNNTYSPNSTRLSASYLCLLVGWFSVLIFQFYSYRNIFFPWMKAVI